MGLLYTTDALSTENSWESPIKGKEEDEDKMMKGIIDFHIFWGTQHFKMLICKLTTDHYMKSFIMLMSLNIYDMLRKC